MNSVQACITAIGFPEHLDGVWDMADWHEAESGRWETDLESLFSAGGQEQVGMWTGARWLTEGDILFFYLTSHRPIKRVKKLLHQAKNLENAPNEVELLERNYNLIKQYGGTLFGCGLVTGSTEYLAPDDSLQSLHFKNRYFVPYRADHG